MYGGESVRLDLECCLEASFVLTVVGWERLVAWFGFCDFFSCRLLTALVASGPTKSPKAAASLTAPSS